MDGSAGRYAPLATDDFDDSDEKQYDSVEEHDHDEDADLVPTHDSIFSFVEASWFQVVSACIILFNTIAVFVEADDRGWKKKLFIADQCTLCFYIIELVCRMCFFGTRFLCGSRTVAAWNLLDVLVVTAGVTDQWVLPFCPVGKDSPLFSVILIFRLLRLVRVVKIIRVMLETDLHWTEKPGFQSFIGGVIAFNALLMGFETDIKWEGWFYIEQVLLAIYVFELLVRLKRFGIYFMSIHNPDITWNALDFIIVVSSAADSWLMPCVKIIWKEFSNSDGGEEQKPKGMKLSQVMMFLRMLRLMRILRLVKLVKSVKPLYILVTGVVAAVQGVIWVLLLTVVTLYAVGILATRLLGHGLMFPHGKAPKSAYVFKSVPDSMFTLFRVMSGAQSDEEAYAIDQLMIALPSAKFAFIFFMVTSSWTLLSILTAVVSDTMLSTTGQQEMEEQITADEEEREAHMEELRQLFQDINEWNQREDGNKRENEAILEDDVTRFLKDKDNAIKTAKTCRVSTRNLIAVLRTLSPNQTPVKREEFVMSLLDVEKPITEQSIMKVETLFKDTQQQFQKGCKKLAKRVLELSAKRPDPEQAQANEKGSKQKSVVEAATALIERQKKNSEHILRLRDSVEALLRSQGALSQQTEQQSALTEKLEVEVKALEQHSLDSVRMLRKHIQVAKQEISVRQNGFSSCAKPSETSDVCIPSCA